MSVQEQFERMLNRAIAQYPIEFRDFDRTKNVQDQLQEMIIDNYREHWGEAVYPGLMEEAVIFAHQYPYTSMAELWLAFVMQDKHHKPWNGEDWVDDEAIKSLSPESSEHKNSMSLNPEERLLKAIFGETPTLPRVEDDPYAD